MNSGGRSVSTLSLRRGRRIARAAVLSAAVLALGACVPETETPPPRVAASPPPPAPEAPAPPPAPKADRAPERPAPVPVETPDPAKQDTAPVVVGILLPLSGEERELGRAMLNGAMMAVFDHAAPGLALKPYDTAGTPAGAAEAAEAALKDGARLLLGPLFSDSVAAVAPVAARAGVNVLAFTNDRAAAGRGVFVLGHHLEPQIRAVIAYAGRRGIRSLAVLIPTGRFGAQAAVAADAAAREAGIGVHEIAVYTDDVPSIDRAIRRLARYDGRKAALREHRADLKRRGDAGSLAILERLKNRDTLGNVDFDAILVPSGSSPVYAHRGAFAVLRHSERPGAGTRHFDLGPARAEIRAGAQGRMVREPGDRAREPVQAALRRILRQAARPAGGAGLRRGGGRGAPRTAPRARISASGRCATRAASRALPGCSASARTGCRSAATRSSRWGRMGRSR